MLDAHRGFLLSRGTNCVLAMRGVFLRGLAGSCTLVSREGSSCFGIPWYELYVDKCTVFCFALILQNTVLLPKKKKKNLILFSSRCF